MKEIIITSKKYGTKSIKVDDEDFELINKWKWHLFSDKRGKFLYARRTDRSKGKATGIYMHRFILNENNPDMHVDHKDHDTLNNCKSNLRSATRSQNCTNRLPAIKKSSKYVGVTPNRQYWRARITINHKLKFIGVFPTEKEAALAYNKEAIKLHKDFAYINTIE